MSIRATDRRRHARPAALALLLTAGLAGCVTHEYVRGLGHHAAKGAMGGVADGIPAIEEPLRHSCAALSSRTRRCARRPGT